MNKRKRWGQSSYGVALAVGVKPQSVGDLAMAARASRTTAGTVVASLHERGLVRRIDTKGRWPHWALNPTTTPEDIESWAVDYGCSPTRRKCRDCGEVRDLSDFRWARCVPCGNRRGSDLRLARGAIGVQRGPNPPGGARQRDTHLRTTYGITEAEYDARAIELGNKCQICGETERGRRLAVDHCHETGTIRGLLCLRCNTKLPIIENHLEAALEYLNGPPLKAAA